MTNPLEPTHITSLVVHADPAAWQHIITRVRRLPAAEVHFGEPRGKFIVLLETENEQQILAAIDQIRELDGVLSATMVYHHIDE